MLVLNIVPICKAGGIAQPFKWLRKHGVSHTMAHTILSGKYKHPRLALIEHLCLLLDCVPNDLLTWVPDDGQPATRRLSELLPKNEQAFDWVHDLDSISPGTLRALGEKLKELQAK